MTKKFDPHSLLHSIVNLVFFFTLKPQWVLWISKERNNLIKDKLNKLRLTKAVTDSSERVKQLQTKMKRFLR